MREIKKLVSRLWPNAQVEIYKSWCNSEQRRGWIAWSIGINELYLGRTVKEAIEFLQQKIDA